MVQKQEKETRLILIPKAENYIEYMLQIILKLPRVEKFSIGAEYKKAMYEMTENILIINKIDASLSLQRIYLRIMKKNRWIDEHKFKVAMEKVYEIGKILGGLIKYYAKNDKK